MLRYTARRFLEMILTVFIITTATFFILNSIPGNPLTEALQKMTPQARENMVARYGYDKPVGERYIIFIKGLVTKLDFGASIKYPGVSMKTILRDNLPVSARLGLQQFFVGIVIGLLFGIICAMKKGTWIDYSLVTFAIILISAPSFIFSLLLQSTFCIKLRWFPPIGWPKGKDLWFGGWKYTIMPTLAGTVGFLAYYTRMLKTSMLDIINQDYVLTAKAKGLSKIRIIRKHIFRNSFIPILTNLPVQIAFCITGSFFIEQVFSIPGLGYYYVNSIQAKDTSMVMGQTIVLAIMYIICLFITDLLYPVVDPRIRITGGKR